MNTVRVISLGAGVQSSTLALMAAHGEIGHVDCAIFSDTKWEPAAVYEHLRWLGSGNVLPFPIYQVSAGDIRADLVASLNTTGQRFASIPFFIDTGAAKEGRGPRQCTKEYKPEPIKRKIRELIGPGHGARAKVLIGISTDEAHRMKPSQVGYIENEWPLIDKRMSRWDCLQWLRRHGYPEPPKSSCIGCPFHPNAHWRDMKINTPEEFTDAVEVDRLIRNGGSSKGLRGQQYMHRSLKPLGEVDLRNLADRGQQDLFGEECEGMCDV